MDLPYDIPDLEYNSERPKLIIPEYGRHVQKMVKYCKTIEDRRHRNQVAQSIIDVMGNLNPHLRDVPDFQHKLWDQLFIMSEFELDVDSPFPIPEPETFTAPPERIAYPEKSSKYRYYGLNIKRMIEVALSWPEGDKRDALVRAIANHMKKCYLNWNKDSVEDSVIFAQLLDISDGAIDLTDYKGELVNVKISQPRSQKQGSHKQGPQKQGRGQRSQGSRGRSQGNQNRKRRY